MKVKTVIALLEKMQSPEEDIVICWWDRKCFEDSIDQQVWDEHVEIIEGRVDWGYMWEQINTAFEDTIKFKDTIKISK